MVLVVNHGNIKSIGLLTGVIRLQIIYVVDIPRHCFSQEVMWTLAIRYQLSTVSALDLDRVDHRPQSLPPGRETDCLPEGK
jgi:hypothetical protein